MKKQRKLLKIIYEYNDGAEEITGKQLKNFEDNMALANSLAITRSYVKFKPVKWKKLDILIKG